MSAALKQNAGRVDLFTFCQRLPETTPKYEYYMDRDDIAVLPVKSYDHWWSKQIKSSTRAMVRKAAKQDVLVRKAEFDDDFVRGMVSIFNETPIRQDRRYGHYEKDFGTVKREFSKYLFREELLGAYYKDELIGFIMLAYTGQSAVLSQIISKVKYRDKAPNNALIAKAVECCDQKKIPYLVYARWDMGSSLTEFKRHNGFENVSLPRYYVPLTVKGRVVLRLGLHRRLEKVIPEGIKARLKKLRVLWYARAKSS
jgi:hypothetical protein